MRYFILGLFAALAVAVPVARAAAVKATPSYSITAAKVSGKNVKFDLLVKAASNVPGCKGTVTASHKISKKNVKSWTGKLKTSGTDCATTIKGKLPKSKFGKKVKFSIKFPGNKVIKKFGATKSLTLSPPAPAGPTGGGTDLPGVRGPQKPGVWYMFNAEPGSIDIGMKFTIRDDFTVAGLTRPGALKMVCAPGGNTQIPFNWSNSSFGMGAPSGVVTSGDSNPSTSNMVYTVAYNFSGPHAGTGSFSATGNFRSMSGGSFDPCSVSYPVTFTGGNP